MSDPSITMIEKSVLAQCLDFSRQLITNQKTFKFDVKLSCGFSFNFNTLDQEPTESRSKEVKKKSPSTLKRNAARKQKFLDEKKNSSARNQSSEISFKCDQCDLEANCKVSLRKHMEKEHKVIPQLDGFEDDISKEENSSQTEDVKVNEVEVQTDSSDTKVTVNWGEQGHLALPPGTVVLKYQDKTMVVDYPVMSLPVTWVFHPLWGLGKYDEDENDENEFIVYRFDGNEIHTGGKKKL